MKTIYVTWHCTTHGIAYFKHILSEFYLKKLTNKEILFENLNPEKLNAVFDNPHKNYFLFDEVIYLTAPQEAFDEFSRWRFDCKKNILEDNLIVESGLKEVYQQIIANDDICCLLDRELEFVKTNFPDKIEDFKNTIWRNIQYYPVEEQIKWLTESSNFGKVYQDKLKSESLAIDDLQNEKQIADKMSDWAKKYFAKQDRDTQYIINVSSGSSETQVVWHILAESGLLPANTRFIKTYDDKTESGAETSRFKLFSIKEIPVKLIPDISESFKFFPETKSKQRTLVNLKMAAFLKTGFSILLIGERGTGKTQIASEASKNNEKFVTANCASFVDDTMAESELFGYEKGAFTGLKEGKSGLFADANGGILFLDEIHNLSKSVQATLMTALQTDTENNMHIRKLGSTKTTPVKCRLIFATNRTVDELREWLLPDFYDRIAQHIIEIPPLRDTVKDREEDWNNIWKQLKFDSEAPKEQELLKWLKGLKLFGNYHDLQKIAIYYNAFNHFDKETKEMLNKKTPFEYAKNEFEKYHSQIAESKDNKIDFQINSQKTANEILADFQFQFQNWAINKYGSRTKASEQLKVSKKTLNNWKNRNSLK